MLSSRIKISVTAAASVLLSSILFLSLSLYEKNPLFALAIPVVFFLVFAVLLKPELSLAVILCSRALLDPFLELTKMNFSGQSMGIGAGLNILVILLAAIFFIKKKNKAGIIAKNSSWLIFLLIAALSITYTQEKGGAIRFLFVLLSYFCMFIIPFLIVNNPAQKKFWERVLFISIVLTVIGANVDLARGGHEYQDAGRRVGGTFSHPNILAFYTIWAIAAVFYMLKRDASDKDVSLPRWPSRLLIINLFALLLGTLTRNAWISCWIFFLIYGLVNDRRIVLALIVFSFVALLFPFARERILELSSTHFSYYEGEDSWSWRLALWDSAFPLILRRPITGYGLSSFFALSSQFFGMENGTEAHSAYVQLLFETGIFGLLSYLFLFGNILSRIRMVISKAAGKLKGACLIVFSYLISYFIINTADNILSYLAFNWYVWFFLGLFLASADLNPVTEEID